MSDLKQALPPEIERAADQAGDDHDYVDYQVDESSCAPIMEHKAFMDGVRWLWQRLTAQAPGWDACAKEKAGAMPLELVDRSRELLKREIERLTKERDEARAYVEQLKSECNALRKFSDTITNRDQINFGNLLMERDRYRKALERINDLACRWIGEEREIAAEALCAPDAPLEDRK